MLYEVITRRNLRQYLHHIRVALTTIDPDGSLLLADGTNIQFNPQVEFSLDIEIFLRETQPVITSYSIHYTKLYDLLPFRLRCMTFEKPSRPDFVIWMKPIRITSYNVCYTKLLRQLHLLQRVSRFLFR